LSKTLPAYVTLKVERPRSAICRRFAPRLPAVPLRRSSHTRKSQDPPSTPLAIMKARKPVPAWNAPTSALLRFFHLGTVQVMVLSALCSAHISVFRAQSCTNEKSPHMHDPLVTITNHYYLEEIGFDPQKSRATQASMHPRRLIARTQTARLRFPSQAEQEVRFFRCLPGAFPTPPQAQRCTNPKPLPLAALWITKEKDGHLSKIGFLPHAAHNVAGTCHTATRQNALRNGRPYWT
jgi:hypothetical protein